MIDYNEIMNLSTAFHVAFLSVTYIIPMEIKHGNNKKNLTVYISK